MDAILNRLLENLYRTGRERTESAILGELLHYKQYLKEFLICAGLPWAVGSASVTCEYPMRQSSGFADLL
jgi:hypothetical protein